MLYPGNYVKKHVSVKHFKMLGEYIGEGEVRMVAPSVGYKGVFYFIKNRLIIVII